MEHTRDRAEEKASRAEDKVCLLFLSNGSKNTCVVCVLGKGTGRGAWHGQQDNQVNEHHG